MSRFSMHEPLWTQMHINIKWILDNFVFETVISRLALRLKHFDSNRINEDSDGNQNSRLAGKWFVHSLQVKKRGRFAVTKRLQKWLFNKVKYIASFESCDA